MNPKISIIVPVYNTSLYLRRCLNSLKNQTLKDYEVIIVDDGSTDSSPQICDEYGNCENFHIFHNSNHGLSYSRNYGMKMAEGDYYLFVDSDDWVDETMCEDLLECAINQKADFVICAHYNEASSGTTEKYIYSKDTIFDGKVYINEIYHKTLGLTGTQLKNPAKLDNLTPVWARLYKANIIKEHCIEYIDTKLIPSEALDFNIKYLTYCSKAYYTHKSYYHYLRTNAQSVTKAFKQDIVLRWEYWYDYMLGNLKKENLTKC